MRRYASIFVPACLCLWACGGDGGDPDEADESGSGPSAGSNHDDGFETETTRTSLAPCVTSASEEERISTLFADTDDSVHELITCAGAQFDLMASLVPQILASNEDLLHPDVAAFVGIAPAPFVADGTGAWVMEPAPGTTLAVEFLRPGSGPDASPIQGNIFRLDAYFEGVVVDAAPTPAMLLNAPREEKQDFSIHWSGPGPLADLLQPEDVARGSLRLLLSADDLLALFRYRGGPGPMPSVGPFGHLLQLPVRSRVEVDASTAWSRVTFSARGPANAVADLLQNQHVPFVFDTLVATDDIELTFDGTARDLRFLEKGVLSGAVDYKLRGEPEGRGGVAITSDFGNGASYPQNAWSCQGTEVEAPGLGESYYY